MRTSQTLTLQSYVERDQWLVERCRGKRILHLGCVGFTDCPTDEKIRLAQQTLHYQLSQVADCVGMDLDGAAVAELQRSGLFNNVLVGDVERLGDFAGRFQPFDLVVAGDIIEHLSNPGLMLDGVKAFLKPEGRLLVSTPNAFGLVAQLRHLRGRILEGAQHVLSFNIITLTQLLNRHGYEVIEAHSCHQRHATAMPGWLFRAGHALFRAVPRYGGTLLVEAKLAG